MYLKQITDPSLAQNAYLIGCQRTGEAVVVDPERDVDRYLKLAAENDLRIVAVADTHIHADYLSGARELMEHHGATAYVTVEGGPDWQMEWAKGHPRAREIRDGDVITVGNIALRVVRTPGHTPEHVSFLVTDRGGGADEPMAMLSGDFLFVGDVGRPDLLESAAGMEGVMESSARVLYESLRATSDLPDYLQVLPAHGAGSACGKALGAVPQSVLGYERRFNPAFREALSRSREDFVESILAGQPEPPLYFARMKRDNREGPALLPGGALPSPSRITGGELGQAIGDGVTVPLDLRPGKSDFMARHVVGSLWAPMEDTTLPEVVGSFVPEKTPLVLLVNREEEVEEAVRQLVRIGYDGITAWIPVEEALAASVATGRIEQIGSADLAKALAESPGGVLDVRRTAEAASGRFRNALQIAHTRLAARLGELPRSGRLYVHCHSGRRAAFAVAFLARQGYEVVHVDDSIHAIMQSQGA